MTYFLIHSNKHGDHYIEPFPTEWDLLQELNRGHSETTFLNEITSSNMKSWTGAVVIRGEIIVPKALWVVKEFKIPTK